MDTKSTSYFLLAPVTGVLVLALTGCASLAGDVREQRYASWGDTPDAGNVALVPPAWMPHDATRIVIRVARTGDDQLLRFRSKTGIAAAETAAATAESGTAPECTAGALTGEPGLTASWWKAAPADGMVCGDWRAFTRGGVTYAWTDGSGSADATGSAAGDRG